MLTGPALDLSGVGLIEQGSVVLRDVTWTAARDERWAVLGPNGSGKTSILRLLSFQRAPSSGSVTVLGDRYGTVDVRTARRRIGLASRAVLPSLRPTLTAPAAHYGPAFRAIPAPRSPGRCDRLVDVDVAETQAWVGRARGHVGRAGHPEAAAGAVARPSWRPELLPFDEPRAGLDLGDASRWRRCSASWRGGDRS